MSALRNPIWRYAGYALVWSFFVGAGVSINNESILVIGISMVVVAVAFAIEFYIKERVA